jgi:predicted transcriptional regulator
MNTALEMLHAQNEWLLENRAAIQSNIAEGLAELDRGEGIREERHMCRNSHWHVKVGLAAGHLRDPQL